MTGDPSKQQLAALLRFEAITAREPEVRRTTMSKLKKCISKCYCCFWTPRLDESISVPAEDSPAWIVMKKYGEGPTPWCPIWQKYTKKGGDRQWPLNGFFDNDKLKFLQQTLFNKNVRQAMWDSYQRLEKETRKRAMKETREYEKQKPPALKLKEDNDAKKEKNIEERDREFRMTINKMYPSWSVYDIRQKTTQDELLENLLDNPPSYVPVQPNAPVQNVNVNIPNPAPHVAIPPPPGSVPNVPNVGNQVLGCQMFNPAQIINVHPKPVPMQTTKMLLYQTLLWEEYLSLIVLQV
ncbi:hypothetical protein NDU88_010625 [Pleurodeles waltl]|uniref:Uncharacterized protein n=1 Tax=Pleurodeles waltl TaxID=8319 RepID=A0AAV7QYS4_PLEWA|nr:hypothetical protein NDU88_010625 [Pleurodeles waltl]